MTAIGILKSVSNLVVSTGTGIIVGNAIKATTPVVNRSNIKALRLVQDGSVAVSSLVLSGMLGDMASKYADAKVDEIYEQYVRLRTVVKEASSDAADTADDVAEDVKKAASKIKDNVKSAAKDVRDDIKD